MKKSLVAVAALSVLAGAVQAQSSVTLYGVADAGITHVTHQEGGTRLISGIMEGSRFGFRGNEDIGGGYRAIFTLENRLELDTGAVFNRPPSGNRLPARFNSAAALGLPAPLQPAVSGVAAQLGAQVGVNHTTQRLFDRQAFVGLVTPVGAVLLGRQYTPAYEVSAIFDTMHTESSLAFGQVAAFPPSLEIRTDNAAAYRIQKGPITAALMYALGEGSATTGRLISANAYYRTPAFAAGVAYASRENEVGDKSLTNYMVGAYGNVGPGTLHALYVNVKDDNPAGLTPARAALTPQVGPAFANLVVDAFSQALEQDADAYHIGYKITTGPHVFSVAYSRYDDQLERDADVQSYGAVYQYALSKRTDVNFVLTRFDNNENAQAAPGQACCIGGFTLEPGQDPVNWAVGLRHRF